MRVRPGRTRASRSPISRRWPSWRRSATSSSVELPTRGSAAPPPPGCWRAWRDMRIGLVVPGFSADPGDWCIPALRHLAVRLAGTADVHIFALRYPDRRGPYQVFGAQVTALGGGDATGGGSARLWQRTAS